MSDKGFTLIEMLCVLFVISMLVLMFPFMKVQKEIQLRFEMDAMKEIFLTTQVMAYDQHRQTQVNVNQTNVQSPLGTYTFPKGMQCTPTTIKYKENGNITRAQSVRCRCEDRTLKLVFQLGSGAIDVRE